MFAVTTSALPLLCVRNQKFRRVLYNVYLDHSLGVEHANSYNCSKPNQMSTLQDRPNVPIERKKDQRVREGEEKCVIQRSE